MADYWLDLARFSETDGFLDDHHDRLLWPWRDWVIDVVRRATCRSTSSARGSSPATCCRTRRSEQIARDGVPARRQAHDRERRDRRRVQGRVHGRAHGQRARHRVPRPDGRLRALPRPQVRPDQADATTTRSARSSTATTSRATTRRASAAFRADRRCRGPTTRRQRRCKRRRTQVAAQSAPRMPPRRPPPRNRRGRRPRARPHRRPTPRRAFARRSRTRSPHTTSSSRRVPLRSPTCRRRARRASRRQPLTEFRRNPFSGRRRRRRPRRPSSAGSAKQFALAARVPRNYNAEALTLSPAATPGVAPAVIQGAAVPPRRARPGVVLRRDEPRLLRQRRRLLRPHASRSRSTSGSTSAHEYDNVPVLNHLAEHNSGRTGYRLTIDNGKLWVSLAHSPPANMIAIETEGAAARRRVDAHHADVRRLEPRRGPHALLERHSQPRLAVVRDHLTRTILPFSSGDVFDPFLGLAVRHALPREGAGRQRHRRAARVRARADAGRGRVPARRDARRRAERSRRSSPTARDRDRRASRRRARRADGRARERERDRDGHPAGARHGRRAGADADVRAESRRLQRPRRAGRSRAAWTPCSRGTSRWPQNRLGLAQLAVRPATIR